MNMLRAIDRVIPDAATSNLLGRIEWTPVQSIWTLANGLLGVVGVVWFFSWGALAVFMVLTVITVCAGHSVGMHRLLIHRSFKTYRAVEYVLVWLGVLVGMAGPMGMIRQHDMRDWHQRQDSCPPHPSHGAGFWRDAWWQMHCTFALDHPPRFEIETRVANDPVYQWMERLWRWRQLPVAVALFFMGGVGFVLWGVCLRVFVTLCGHWAVGHFAHRQGTQGWVVDGVAVQGFNLPRLGLVTFGENWHGNHHAFPHSAKLGVKAGQADPGYWFIKGLVAVGLAWGIQGPNDAPERDGLRRA
jgi:stearoyl-CoA desaturase (delta-9 desaturase)